VHANVVETAKRRGEAALGWLNDDSPTQPSRASFSMAQGIPKPIESVGRGFWGRNSVLDEHHPL